MEFRTVIRTCLDFAIANGGTLQSYSAGQPDKLAVHSRTTKTEIFVDRSPTNPGQWQISQLQDAKGQKNPTKEIFSTKEHLLDYLARFWDQNEAQTV
jgi:hypothetical protein